jgi:CubicO group peptidase (beta-lactamase class C family)
MLGLLGASGVLAVSGTAHATSGSRPIPVDLKPGGALDRLAADLAAKDEFSGSLLLTHRGRTVLTRSYGMANKQLSIPNGPDTVFTLASVTKLFTAVSLAQLVQRGAVAYHDKLGSHIDGFPADIADQVTVHHLLTHTSGLGDHMRMPGFWEAAATWTSAEEVMDGTTAFIRRSELAFAPGAGMAYSNSGYHLLGAIVAKASGQSYYDYVREHVFRPAGMSRSDFYTTPQWRDDRRIARPYKKSPSGERVDDIGGRIFIGTPAGDAFSTCADLDRFAHALLDDDLLNPAHTRLTLSGKVPLSPPPRSPEPPSTGAIPQAAFQCYGPIAILIENQWSFGHGGGSPGASTEVQMYSDSDWVSVILSNYDMGTVLPIASLARTLITRPPSSR